jgi:hypothetical protein
MEACKVSELRGAKKNSLSGLLFTGFPVFERPVTRCDILR